MSKKIYGYIRVSTKEQNEDRQRIALEKFGVPDDAIYLDKQSGKDFDRPAYKKLIKKLRRGDVFVIKSLDRLGRSYDEMIEQWRAITKQKGVRIVVLDMPLLHDLQDSDQMGKLIADLVLYILSYFAETERTFILQRQAEGIAAAKARGVKFGRPNSAPPEAFVDIYNMWKRGRLSARKAAECLSVDPHTFRRWVERYKKEGYL